MKCFQYHRDIFLWNYTEEINYMLKSSVRVYTVSKKIPYTMSAALPFEWNFGYFRGKFKIKRLHVAQQGVKPPCFQKF